MTPSLMAAAGNPDPAIDENFALANLPWSYYQEGRKLIVAYFGET